MQTIYFLAIIVCSWIRGTHSQVSGPPDNAGKEFILMFMDNAVEKPDVIEKLELFITTAKTKPVHFNVSTPKFHRTSRSNGTVSAGQVQQIFIEDEVRMSGSSKDYKGVWVTADDDIVVYGVNKEQYSNDAFLAFPSDVLGNEYYTVSYWPAHLATQFGIVARFDGTFIQIVFPSNTTTPIHVEYNRKRYSNGDSLNVTLNRLETFQAQSIKTLHGIDPGDLTGTFVRSSRPIAVFSGNIRTYVGKGQKSRDHLSVQLPPVESWGRRFVTAPSPKRTVGDIVRIVSSEPNTMVEIIGYPRFELKQPGLHHQQILPSKKFLYIMATKPILVAMISQSQNSTSELGDPSMWLVPSIEQHGNDYSFSTTKASLGSYENYFMLVIEERNKNGLLLDGQNLSEIVSPNWVPVPSTPYVGCIFPVTEGAHDIKHESPVVIFAGFLYGLADKETYAVQIGMRLSRINTPCIPSQSQPGDGIDNDCDGRIDEELCMPENNKQDDDSDGRRDEDCATGPLIRTGLPDAGGTEFILMYMENHVEEPEGFKLELYVTTVYNKTVSVNVTSPRVDNVAVAVKEHFSVSFGMVHKVEMSPDLRPYGTGYSQAGILVQSNDEIVVYGINKEKYSNDAFLALPTDTVGIDYVTVCYTPANIRCQFGIVGTKDNTKVTIEFPRTSYGGIPIEVNFYGQTYRNGDVLNLTISRLEAVQIQSIGDLSGTHIKSNVRISAFSGNVRTHVDGTSRDHLAVQLPPVQSLGMEYITMPFPGRTRGDYFKIVSTKDNTRIQVSRRPDIILSNAGDVLQLNASSSEYLSIKSSHPILVVQIAKSQEHADSQEKADPTMLILPSIEQYSADYTFATTKYSLGNYTNYVMITIRTGTQYGLYMDDQLLKLPDGVAWYNIPLTIFSVVAYQIEDGVHTLRHEDPSATFAVYVYGSADRESYGFAVGMRLRMIHIPCFETLSIPGDGIDNDCDGKIDEELCTVWNNGKDDDNDGRSDEDCILWLETATATSIATSSTASAVSTPSTKPPNISKSSTTMTTTIEKSSTTSESELTTSKTTPSTQPPVSQPPVYMQGPPGPAGLPGLVGPSGLRGDAGRPGPSGRPGQEGPRGYTGVNGNPGVPGPQGPRGLTGVNGAVGPVGQKGSRGPVGTTGLPGQQGDHGPYGPPGEKGFTGSTGNVGPVGQQGLVGPPGLDGLRGLKGEKGIHGLKGNQGIIGLKGQKGQIGTIGLPGPDIYVVANKTIVIDQCSKSNGGCSAECTNTLEGPVCSCTQGYSLNINKKTCVDVNECVTANGGCSHICVNSMGSYSCTCPHGLALNRDRHSCDDVDECTIADVCSNTGLMCLNSVGSYNCANITNEVIMSGLMKTSSSGLQGTDLSAKSAATSQCNSAQFELLSDTMAIVFIVWLLAITILLLILIMCIVMSKHERHRDEKRRIEHLEAMTTNSEIKSFYFPTVSQRSRRYSSFPARKSMA